jgi:uncharacterized protein YraI
MTLRTRLLGAGSALLLSAGAAAAAPAVVSTDLNMRSGPGTQYGVITTIPGGATVDVDGCTGSWCAVNFNGRSGYASASYLQGGASVGGGAVAVVPGYVDEPYDDYYDYGYSYGPSIGIYAGPRYRYGWRGGNWRGRHHGGWAGRPGWNRPRTGNWQGRPGFQGGPRVGTAPIARPVPSGGPRVGAPGGGPRVSAPAGMPRGGSGAAVRVGGGGGGPGAGIRVGGGNNRGPGR